MNHPNWYRLTTRGFEFSVAIFDMDGVLSDASHRQHHLASDPPDWEAFGASSHLDPPLVDGPSRLFALSEDHLITVVSARPEGQFDATREWLARHGLPVDVVILRPPDDRRPSELWKRDELGRLRALGGEVAWAFEDDPANHAMYVAGGVPNAIYVHSGYYEQGRAPH